MPQSDFLIVGLGNPGAGYQLTRHNIGFMAIEHFAAANGWVIEKVKFDGMYCRHRLASQQIVLLKPETYMNRSGYCVAAFVNFFKIPVANILVIHDDLDLESGRVKVVARGGSGGHKGIASIAGQLGKNNFCRVKAGIGRPSAGGQNANIPVDRFVLSKFKNEELAGLEDIFLLTDQAIELFLSHGVAHCMNEINRKIKGAS